MALTKEQRDAVVEGKRARQEAAGIPDSPIGGVGTDTNPVLDLHIGGMLVRDLPEEAQRHILYRQTDEALAASNVGKSDLVIAELSDPFAKALQEKRDDVNDRDYDSYSARDPLREVADAHAVPGMRPKFLSAKGVKDRGGLGDHVVVKQPNGDPVMVRGMVLGHMPETKAASRNKHYRDRGNKMLAQIGTDFKKEGGATAVADQ